MDIKEIFGKRLRQARQRAGLSMDALCQKMNNEVSKQTISKYEAGKVMAGSAILIKIADALNVSSDYFFKPFAFDVDSINISFRKKASVGSKEITSLKLCIQENVEKFLNIERILGVEAPSLAISVPATIKTEAQMKALAKQVREKWGLGISPIPCVKDLLMIHGIKVFEIDGPTGFDGISGQANGNVNIIVNNRSIDTVERKRFTQMHELAHLLANNNFDSKLSGHERETLCHVFASEILLPSSVLEANFGHKSIISFSELVKTQIIYGISIDAIMYSLKRSAVISDKRHRSYCIRKNTQSDFKRSVEKSRYKEPESDRNYNPDAYQLLVCNALAQELISPAYAAELLDCCITEVTDLKLAF